MGTGEKQELLLQKLQKAFRGGEWRKQYAAAYMPEPRLAGLKFRVDVGVYSKSSGPVNDSTAIVSMQVDTRGQRKEVKFEMDRAQVQNFSQTLNDIDAALKRLAGSDEEEGES